MTKEDAVHEIAQAVGGKVEEMQALPDGSGFAVVSFPLRADHWLYEKAFAVPPMPFRLGTGPFREEVAEKVRAAARYAIRASTMNGADPDFDPDAMVQNFVVGLLGYWTPDGLSTDAWANPPGKE